MKRSIKNRGITLVALVITIIISLILLSVSIVTIKNSIDKSALSNFGNEINDIQDATKSYYILNNALPKKESIAKLSKNDVLALVGATNQTAFSDELTQNGDNTLDEFYEVDISKLGIENTTKGLATNGSNDIYVVSYPSINIYYLKGVKANKTMYFSTINVVAYTKVNSNSIDTSEVSTQIVAGMTVKKSNAKWSNKLGFSLVSKLTTEEVFIEISGLEGSPVTKKINLVSEVEISFNSLAELNALNILDTNLTAQQISDFENTVGTKQIKIIKKQSGAVVGEVKLDYTNYDSGIPNVSNVIFNNYENMNSITISVSDNVGSIKSGIKEVRYDYLKKYLDNNTITEYYPNVTSFDESYMLNIAKKVEVPENNIVDIKLPKNVNVVKVAVIDNAGNVYMESYDISLDIYTSHRLVTYSANVLAFSLNINSLNGVNKVDTYYSLDGITYSNQKTVVLNTANTTSKVDFLYENIDINKNKIFVKTVVTDRNGDVDINVFSYSKINNTEYIKSGLILSYDAINNLGNTHLNTSKVWEDLSFKNNDGDLKNFVVNDTNSGFRETSLKFDGVDDTLDTGLPGSTTFTADSDFTISVMFDFNTVTAIGTWDSNGEGDIGIILGCAYYSGYGISWRTPIQGDTSTVEITSFLRVASNRSRVVKNIVATDKKCCFTQVYSKSKNKHELYYNGVLVGSTTAATNDVWLDGNQLGNIGINKDQIYSGSAASTFADMNVYNARIYNRALSQDEVQINYDLDRTRYGY